MKSAQSILDFLPIQALRPRNATIDGREVNALLEIWNSNPDGYGNIPIPVGVDAIIVASLANKGFLETKGIVGSRSVVITNKGKNTIKNIILNEKSAFEKQSNRLPGLQKIAHRIKNSNKSNWITRAFWN